MEMGVSERWTEWFEGGEENDGIWDFFYIIHIFSSYLKLNNIFFIFLYL